MLSCLLSILLWYNGRKAQQDVGGMKKQQPDHAGRGKGVNGNEQSAY
ncbi:hypothetical protein I656_03146 [Geobacillus sp. WSUCF1]|nr:hypothetical protein I656_03146 [Geobacillus sp. WSUCF1]